MIKGFLPEEANTLEGERTKYPFHHECKYVPLGAMLAQIGISRDLPIPGVRPKNFRLHER